MGWDYDSMNEDEYVEKRFEWNQFLASLTKPQLIRLINGLQDQADYEDFPLTISDEELDEILATGEDESENENKESNDE